MMKRRNNSKLLQPINKSEGARHQTQKSHGPEYNPQDVHFVSAYIAIEKSQEIKIILASSFAYSSSICHKPLHCLLIVRFTLFTNLLKKFKKILHPKLEQDITKLLTQRPLAFRKIRTLERALYLPTSITV